MQRVFALVVGVAVLLAAPATCSPPECEGFDIGTQPGGVDVVRNGEAQSSKWTDGFATAAKPTGQLYVHMANGSAPQAFSVSVSVDATYNEAKCTPSVSPTSGTATPAGVPVTVTYNCQDVGATRIFFKVTFPGGAYAEIDLFWLKYNGNALDVVSLVNSTQAVTAGVATPAFSSNPTFLRDAHVMSDTFLLRLHPNLLPLTKYETFKDGGAIQAVCSEHRCGPALSGTATTAYHIYPTDTFSLTVTYNCGDNDGPATVTVTVEMPPFGTVTFSWLKYCQYLEGFFISSNANLDDVVRNGFVVPTWSPSQNESADFPFPSTRYGFSDTVTKFNLTTGPRGVTYRKPQITVSPSPGPCTVTTTGPGDTNTALQAHSSTYFDVNYDCTGNGYILVTVLLELPPYLEAVFTWAKFTGFRPGFMVTMRNDTLSHIPPSTPLAVVTNGQASTTWMSGDISFPASTVVHTFDFYMEPGKLPYGMLSAVTVGPTGGTGGKCDPFAFGPMMSVNNVVHQQPQQLTIVFWCSYQAPVSFKVTIPDPFYDDEDNFFEFSKDVQFLEGFRVGPEYSGDSGLQWVFIDGQTGDQYLPESPTRFQAPDKTTSFYIERYEDRQPTPGPVTYGAPQLVLNDTRWCSPKLSGEAAAGGTLDVDDGLRTLDIDFNCVPGGVTLITVVVPLSIQDPSHPSQTLELSPALFAIAKVSIADKPARPNAPKADGGNHKVDLKMTVPDLVPDDYFIPVTSYTVHWTEKDGSATSKHFGIPNGGLFKGDSTTLTVSGLTNGHKYTFTVVATNAAGDSEPSPPVSATPSLPWVLIIVCSVIGGLLVIGVATFYIRRAILRRRAASAPDYHGLDDEDEDEALPRTQDPSLNGRTERVVTSSDFHASAAAAPVAGAPDRDDYDDYDDDEDEDEEAGRSIHGSAPSGGAMGQDGLMERLRGLQLQE